jgi:hypothetical protein
MVRKQSGLAARDSVLSVLTEFFDEFERSHIPASLLSSSQYS